MEASISPLFNELGRDRVTIPYRIGDFFCVVKLYNKNRQGVMMMSKLPHVFVIGGTSVDEIIPLDRLPEPVPQTIFTTSSKKVGSTGSGKGLSLHLLGVPTVLHSLIGLDTEGEMIRDFFNKYHLPFIFDIDSKGTEKHINLMSKSGERISFFTRFGSSGINLQNPSISHAINDADLIALNIISYTKQLIPLLEETHKPIWVDLHDYQPGNPYYDDFINVAEVLFMSSDRISDYEKVMIDFIKSGKKMVICTHGNKGSTALDQDYHWFDCPVLPYKYIDGNGAGDNFFSGFLYGYFKDQPLDVCMKYATIVAGLCISSGEIANPRLSVELLEKEYKRFYSK